MRVLANGRLCFTEALHDDGDNFHKVVSGLLEFIAKTTKLSKLRKSVVIF